MNGRRGGGGVDILGFGLGRGGECVGEDIRIYIECVRPLYMRNYGRDAQEREHERDGEERDVC